MKPECRRAKKASWKRHKMDTDPKFKADQKLINKKWAQNNPEYWKNYRKNNSEKTERNQALQKVRNLKRTVNQRKRSATESDLIAKVDSSIPYKNHLVGRFWVIPVIAKVDSLKVNIYEISKPYQ